MAIWPFSRRRDAEAAPEPEATAPAAPAASEADVARPERTIAIVGHGTFFYHLTGEWLANCQVLPLDLDPPGR